MENKTKINSSLKKRIITALVLLPVALFAIFEFPLWGFSVFCAVVMAIGAWEWGPFIGFNKKRLRIFLVLLVISLISGLFYVFDLPTNSLALSSSEITQYSLYVAGAWWVAALGLVISYPKSAPSWNKQAVIKLLFGFLTLIPTWIAATLIRSTEYNVDQYYGAWLLLFVMALVWAADIGAYFAGKAFGQRKLMPNVSPGKTVEGMLGGLIAALTLVFVVSRTSLLDDLTFVEMVLISLVVIISSVLGDLLESMLKRQAGVKDSGTILPGHGGILDRIDSLTAALPVFALLYFFII